MDSLVYPEQQYTDLLRNVLEKGRYKQDRTGVGCYSLFGAMMRYDLRDGFPLYTGKFTSFQAVKAELLWFLKGSTNTQDLDSTIWDEWATEDGDLGPLYGQQWRNWQGFREVTPGHPLLEKIGEPGCAEYRRKTLVDPVTGHETLLLHRSIDQIQRVIWTLRNNPNSRRVYLSSWNPEDIPDETISPQANVREGRAALPPCHTSVQFQSVEMTHDERLEVYYGGTVPTTSEGISAVELMEFQNTPTHRLNVHVNMRSNDLPLGHPFNIASYALLLAIVAQCVGMAQGELVWTAGDVHIYENQVPAVKELLEQPLHPFPRLELNPMLREIDDFWQDPDGMVIDGYQHSGRMSIPVAV